MAPKLDDEEAVRIFMERLDRGDLDGHLTDELPKLTYAQLLRVGRILAERRGKQREK